MGNNNFEAKKAIVLAGNSKIYKNWSEHSNYSISRVQLLGERRM